MESLGIGSDCENEMCSCGSSCKHRFLECFKEPNVMFVFECSKQIKARERGWEGVCASPCGEVLKLKTTVK